MNRFVYYFIALTAVFFSASLAFSNDVGHYPNSDCRHQNDVTQNMDTTYVEGRTVALTEDGANFLNRFGIGNAINESPAKKAGN